MGRCNDGLALFMVVNEQVHQFSRRPGIQPAVGSSRIRTSGEKISTEARAAFLFSPKLIWCGTVMSFFYLQRFNNTVKVLVYLFARHPKINGRIRYLPWPWAEKLDLGVLEHKSNFFLKEQEILRIKAFIVQFSPNTLMLPLSGKIRPVKHLEERWLPEPFAPMKRTFWPGSIAREIP